MDVANQLGEDVGPGQPGTEARLQRAQTGGEVRAGGRRGRTPTAGRHTLTLRTA
jgi:hypothetical protein